MRLVEGIGKGGLLEFERSWSIKVYFLIAALLHCLPRQFDRQRRKISERIIQKLSRLSRLKSSQRISKLPLMLPFRVQDSKDYDVVTFHAIKQFVGKTARKQPAKIAVIKWPPYGVGFQQVHRPANLVQQFIAQTRSLGFIP